MREIIIVGHVCGHDNRASCAQCGERFCPACDPYHRTACLEANKP